jgi:FMN phosphatase YigB (HAD superfamily)
MKTILVDAWQTLITPKGINRELYEMLESFPNPKIVVTNANPEEQERFGINLQPYPVFTCSHNPDKSETGYFKNLMRQYNFSISDLLYFEHSEIAVVSAQSLNIRTFWYDTEKNDVE